MANMSYCKFRNTVQILQDCYDNLDDDVDKEEEKAKKRLVKLCKKIAESKEMIKNGK